MPDIDLFSILADAYQSGQFAGRSFRWVVLLAVGAVLVRRLVRGSFGAGFRRSPAGTVLGLVVVAAGLIASVAHDFRGDDMRPARASIVAGCTSAGSEAKGLRLLRRPAARAHRPRHREAQRALAADRRRPRGRRGDAGLGPGLGGRVREGRRADELATGGCAGLPRSERIARC